MWIFCFDVILAVYHSLYFCVRRLPASCFLSFLASLAPSSVPFILFHFCGDCFFLCVLSLGLGFHLKIKFFSFGLSD